MPIVGSFAGASARAYGFQSGVQPLILAFDSIQTITVGGGGASSVDFTSIPSTYTHLQIRGISRATAAIGDQMLYFQLNGDTSSNYSYHAVSGNGSSAASSGASSASFLIAQQSPGNNKGASMYGSYVIDILDYANTNKFKTTRCIGGFDANGSGELGLTSGNWRNTNAITSIKLYLGIYNFAQYSSFGLYGVKA
jgi:hypothetical protein